MLSLLFYSVSVNANSMVPVNYVGRYNVAHEVSYKLTTIGGANTRRSSMVPRSMCFGVQSRKLSKIGWSSDGWPKIYYLKFLRASEDMFSRWSRLHLQSLAPNNLPWSQVLGYDRLTLVVFYDIHGRKREVQFFVVFFQYSSHYE
jgi:hypothetical protein